MHENRIAAFHDHEADKTITLHIETSTFPNWDGTEQKRPVITTGDELKWVTPASTGTDSAEVVLNRAKQPMRSMG